MLFYLKFFALAVENLADFTVAATNVTPVDTTPGKLSSSDYAVCTSRDDPIPLSSTVTFRCDSTDVFGRYVFVLRNELNKTLQLCEVEVFVYKRRCKFMRPLFTIRIPHIIPTV